MNRCLSILLLALIAPVAQASAVDDWPTIPIPQSAQVADVGDVITTAGTPMRVQVLLSERSVSQMAEWYREKLGIDHVENHVQGRLVLGRRVGKFYESVQLQEVPGGTRCVVGITKLEGLRDAREEHFSQLRRWLYRMPADTKVVTDVRSSDGGNGALYLAMVNAQSEQLNRDRLTTLMSEDGYVLEPASRAQAAAVRGGSAANSTTLFFRGVGKEAVATVHRNAEGQTTIVVNTITALERVK